MDETQAVAHIKRGDLAGLEALVLRYQVKAVYAAYLVVHDRPSAEDIVQAAFLQAVDRIGQFDDQRPFGPWFLRSVVNAAIDVAEQQNRWLPLEPETGDETPVTLDWLTRDAASLEELVETHEIRMAVRKALNQLSPEQRAAIVFRHFLEMNEAEMTRSLHRPPSTIKWWLHTARQRLKELLIPVWISGFGETREELRDEEE